jgi:hypothetical protein
MSVSDVLGAQGGSNHNQENDGRRPNNSARTGRGNNTRNNTNRGSENRNGNLNTINQRNSNNPLENLEYTRKVQDQMASGDHHGFPSSVEGFGADGIVRTIIGGDEIPRTIIEISGGYGKYEGVFEFIIEPSGVSNHRFFRITGR